MRGSAIPVGLMALVGAGLFGPGCGGPGTSRSAYTGGAAGSQGSGSGGSAGSSRGDTGGTGGDECPEGTEACPCYGNGTCNAGLTCASGLCVDLGDGGSPGSGGSGGDGPVETGGAQTAGAPGVGGAISGVGGSEDTCPPSDEIGACDPSSFEAQTRPVNVLLVLDKSGSMNDTPEGYSMSKWDALRTALSASLASVRGVVSFGLQFFPVTANPNLPIPAVCSEPTDRCCEMPTDAVMNVSIGPGDDTVAEILGQLNNAEPAGGSPTAYALSRAYDYFTAGAGAALGGSRIVLLATDGAPNCNSDISCSVDTCTLNLEEASGCPPPTEPGAVSCCGSRPEACLDADGALSQIERLADQGIQTIIVGIPGSELYQGNLQDFAAAGGFTKPNGDLGYYEVSAAGGVDELTQTFAEITISLVTDCEIPITQEIPDLNQVNVAVDCNIIPRGDQNGEEDRWFFDNDDAPTRIIINGPICDTIQTAGVDRIDILLGCPTVSTG